MSKDTVPENNPQEENTVTFKRSHLYVVLLPLAFVVGLSVGYIFWGRTPGTEVAQEAVSQVDVPPRSVDVQCLTSPPGVGLDLSGGTGTRIYANE